MRNQPVSAGATQAKDIVTSGIDSDLDPVIVYMWVVYLKHV